MSVDEPSVEVREVKEVFTVVEGWVLVTVAKIFSILFDS